MRKVSLTIFLVFFCSLGFSQISIDYCQQKARENYPLYKNYKLLEKTTNYTLENANRNYLPQVNFSIKTSYQSDVTKIDFDLPFPINIDFPEMKKDQYQAFLEIGQLIWDGGLTSNKKKEAKAELESQNSTLEVELYNLKDRIANIFFGILSIKEQKTQALLMEKELGRNIKQIEAYIESGLANQSDLDLIKVEELTIKQRISEIEIMEKTYIKLLSIFIGEELSVDAEFSEPELKVYNLSNNIFRPELKVFDSQIKLIDIKKRLVNNLSMPQISAFAQGGYGRPALNMFNEDFDFYGIIGLRLNLNISSLYTKSNKINILEVNKQLVESNRNAFLFNTNIQLENQNSEISRLESQLKRDNEIIQLRERIKKASEFKLENGTISVSDYIKDVNAEDISKQNQILHRIQLLMSIYKYNNIINQPYEK